MPSEDSSRDKIPPLATPCTACGHVYNWHFSSGSKTCTAHQGECGCPGFAWEPPDSASSSPDEQCGRCPHAEFEHGQFSCRACLNEDRGSDSVHAFAPAEPKAPECEHPRPYNYGLRNGPPVRRFWLCQDCKARWETVGDEIAPEAEPPRRPPYAVAYATEDGMQYEVALPGDATVCAQQGALVITHGSAVQALIQIRPMEGA